LIVGVAVGVDAAVALADGVMDGEDVPVAVPVVVGAGEPPAVRDADDDADAEDVCDAVGVSELLTDAVAD